MTTAAPFNASASPSPVIVLTPVLGAAEIASWPRAFSFSTTFEPISPVPPITTIFISSSLVRYFSFAQSLYRYQHGSAFVFHQEHHKFGRLGGAGVPADDMHIIGAFIER